VSHVAGLGLGLAYVLTNELTMTKPLRPFALPGKLTPELGRVRDYWSGLKRHQNKVPFWDDANLSGLPGLEGRLMLIDVFEKPQRFRLNTVGKDIRDWYGADIVHKFVDEIEAKGPVAYLIAQASATIEGAEPTYYRDSYIRLLLPMWGNGYISMLLGVIICQ
jgi:hypothetical protein